jgi:DNA-binding NarL/FixJ family response regulator
VLSGRLVEALLGMAAGETADETATRLGLPLETMKSRRVEVLRRLGARNAAQAVARGFEIGLLGEYPGA